MASNFKLKDQLRWAFIMLSIILIGCELSVNVDVPEQESTYVLYSLFSPDSVWKVNLSKSQNVLNEDPFIRFEDATVTIHDENDGLVEILTPTGNGNYEGKSYPKVGKQYKIKASINAETILKSVSIIPGPVPIASLEINSSDLQLTFQDPVGIRNFYLIKVVREEKRVIRKSSTTADTVRIVREDFIDPNDPSLEYGYFGTSIFLNDKVFDGQLFLFKARLANPPDTRAYLFSVSEEYYNYYMQVGLQEKNKRDAFAQPVQIISNIENGWGVFGGYSTATKSIK